MAPAVHALTLFAAITVANARVPNIRARLSRPAPRMSFAVRGAVSNAHSFDIGGTGGRRLLLPEASSNVVLPVVSYTTLAGAVAATVRALQPVLGYQLGIFMTGVSVGLPVAAVLGQLALMGGSGVVASLGGTETSDPNLMRLAMDAAAAVGVTAPRVFEVRSHEPNAFAASGFSGRNSAVAVTSGLREILTEDELRAVLAHEMGHLRHRDVMRNVHIAAATAGLSGIYQIGKSLMEAEERKAREKGRDTDDKDDNAMGIALGLMAGGLVLESSAHLLRMAASRHSEIKADRAAAEAYGAETIIDALMKINHAAARRPADLRKGRGQAYAFAMISDGPASTTSLQAAGIGKILRTHPTLAQRVEALEVAAADGSVPRTMLPAGHKSWRWWTARSQSRKHAQNRRPRSVQWDDLPVGMGAAGSRSHRIGRARLEPLN